MVRDQRYERVLLDRFMVKQIVFVNYIGNIINNSAFCSGVSHGLIICKNRRTVFVKTVVPLGSKEKLQKFFCHVILMPLLQIEIQFMIPSDT